MRLTRGLSHRAGKPNTDTQSHAQQDLDCHLALVDLQTNPATGETRLGVPSYRLGRAARAPGACCIAGNSAACTVTKGTLTRCSFFAGEAYKQSPDMHHVMEAYGEMEVHISYS
jgi:hypothetical protein